MPCKPQPNKSSSDIAVDSSRCRCHSAVMRAYNGLVDDQPERVAQQAALRIYKHHHPEDCPTVAKLTVERWLHQGAVH